MMSATIWGGSIIPSAGDPGVTPGDLFDVNLGTAVSSSSPVIDGCNIIDILGGTAGGSIGGCEGAGKVLFKDINANPWPFGPTPPSGASNYYLTFSTATTISLSSYNLYLEDDFIDDDANRTVTEFRLYLDDGAGNPVTLLSDVTILSSGQVNYRTVYGGADDILVSDTIGAVFGSQFSAVFTSNALATTGPGPRVFELDGFGTTAAPEPATWGLIAAGALAAMMSKRLIRRR